VNERTTIQASGAVVAEAAKQNIAPQERVRLASVRVSPGGYLAAMSALTFAALVFLRIESDWAALSALILAWVVVPVLILTDRISFDGRILSRKGVVSFILRLARGRSLNLSIDEIERVETIAVRTLRRGGRVRYRYRSEVAGRGVIFTFASGGNGYRRMVRVLFPLVPDDKLDARSTEMRDYLTDQTTLHSTINLLRLASPDVLDEATSDLQHGAKRGVRHQRATTAADSGSSVDIERGRLLRRAANELRAAGRLREAAEAFRRALLFAPRDGWLIYEFARFLRSQASAVGDARLLARARAGLRLAAQRAGDEAALLARIGESFFDHGDLQQATRSYRRALELDPRAFRAEVGLAEVALRNGKLAHVIHHYAAAARIAPDGALARFARREADYYALLNDDDDYLAAELRRIGWLQNALHARRVAARVTLASILLALVGASVDEAISSVGWSFASSSIVVWIGLTVVNKFLIQRRKARPAE
jgi:tetratricopeptide (TPR) repeat protein